VMVRREERQAVMGWVVGREILIFSFGINGSHWLSKIFLPRLASSLFSLIGNDFKGDTRVLEDKRGIFLSWMLSLFLFIMECPRIQPKLSVRFHQLYQGIFVFFALLNRTQLDMCFGQKCNEGPTLNHLFYLPSLPLSRRECCHLHSYTL
jgi:hypothetical protein